MKCTEWHTCVGGCTRLILFTLHKIQIHPIHAATKRKEKEVLPSCTRERLWKACHCQRMRKCFSQLVSKTCQHPRWPEWLPGAVRSLAAGILEATLWEDITGLADALLTTAILSPAGQEEERFPGLRSSHLNYSHLRFSHRRWESDCHQTADFYFFNLYYKTYISSWSSPRMCRCHRDTALSFSLGGGGMRNRSSAFSWVKSRVHSLDERLTNGGCQEVEVFKFLHVLSLESFSTSFQEIEKKKERQKSKCEF